MRTAARWLWFLTMAKDKMRGKHDILMYVFGLINLIFGEKYKGWGVEKIGGAFIYILIKLLTYYFSFF